jgi:hypothetical protein
VSSLAAQQGDGSGSAADRLLAVLLGILIVVGSALLWLGVPVAGFWAAGRITSNALHGVLFALLAIPVGMIAVGWALARVNARYEALRGAGEDPHSPPSWRVSLGEERASLRRRRGRRRLIDVAMTVSASTAILVMLVWFFFFARQQLSPLP